VILKSLDCLQRHPEGDGAIGGAEFTTMKTLRNDANNDTALGLIAAAHNWRELRHGWCECPPADELMEVFFRDPKTGAHGWMCIRCRKMTQTG
jgi:hypothetical protein